MQLLLSPPEGYRVRPVYATRRHGYSYANEDFLDSPTQGEKNTVRPVEVQSGDIFLALDLAAHLLPRHQAQVLDWKRTGVRLHVLVYDLLPLQHPEWFPSRTERNFKRWMRWLAIYADNAICISASVKDELQNWLKVHYSLPPTALPASIIVLGADINASVPSGGLPNDAKDLLAHLRNTPFVLMVGTIEPRKGHDQALAAFEHLWKQSSSMPSLVLVGRGGWKTEALQDKLRRHPESGKRLFWPQNVSDEYLLHLYAACSGVLVASRAEGFGLPVIEAALHRKPVLARDLPVFREIGLPEITFFTGQDAKNLACAITSWLAKKHLASDAERPQKVDTWRTAAQQLLLALGFTADTSVNGVKSNTRTHKQGAAA
nr:glycosyltransferase family 1 protein [Acidovorax sp. D4N7]